MGYRSNKFMKMWTDFLDLIRKCSMLVSFLAMVSCFILMLWECFSGDLKGTVMYGSVVVVSVFLNHKLQE